VKTPHSHSPIRIICTRNDFTTWDMIEWTTPVVVVAQNEGGANCTCVCLSCLQEALYANKVYTSHNKFSITDIKNIFVYTEVSDNSLRQNGWVRIDGKLQKDENVMEYTVNDGWQFNGKKVRFMEQLTN